MGTSFISEITGRSFKIFHRRAKGYFVVNGLERTFIYTGDSSIVNNCYNLYKPKTHIRQLYSGRGAKKAW